MEEHRKSKRFATNLSARYFLKERTGNWRECTVINICRSGTGLEFYTAEKIDKGSVIHLRIFVSETMEPIDIKGIVRWIKQGKKDFIGGTEAISKEDKDKLADLITLTLGL